MRSLEEARAERAETLERLGQSVKQLVDGDEWQAMLEVASRFHNYSLHNLMMIAMQRSDATRVAGYKAWQAMGRQVMKRERGIRVLAPVIKKVVDEETGDEKRALVNFKMVSVFDVAQTEGAPLPETPAERYARERAGTRATGADFERMGAAAEALGITVHRELDGAAHGGAYGWHVPGERAVHVVEGEPGPMLKTLAHELGHAFDPGLEAWSTYGEGRRSDAEVVAESVSWLLCQALGVETTSTAATYLAAWASEAASGKVTRLAERTLTAGRTIEAALFPGADLQEAA